MIPLIKRAKGCSFSKYLFSPKKIINEFTKEIKIFFGFFGPTRINPRSYVSPFTIENQGYVVLYIIFDIFSRKINLKIGVTRCERPDRH